MARPACRLSPSLPVLSPSYKFGEVVFFQAENKTNTSTRQTMWHQDTFWGGRFIFYSQTLLSLQCLFFRGCPDLVDGLGTLVPYKSGSSMTSLPPPPSESPPTFSSLVSWVLLMTMFRASGHPGLVNISFLRYPTTGCPVIYFVQEQRQSSYYEDFFTFNFWMFKKSKKNKFLTLWHYKRLVEKSTP